MIEQRAAALAAMYRRAADTMADLPLYNAALDVDLTGFRRCGPLYLGVGITPWSMLLIAFPAEGAAENSPAPSEDVHHALPCGPVRFVAAHDAEAGHYLSCSLFSVMTGFPDMDTARAVATACLDEVLRAPDDVPARHAPQVSRRALFGLDAPQDVC